MQRETQGCSRQSSPSLAFFPEREAKQREPGRNEQGRQSFRLRRQTQREQRGRKYSGHTYGPVRRIGAVPQATQTHSCNCRSDEREGSGLGRQTAHRTDSEVQQPRKEEQVDAGYSLSQQTWPRIRCDHREMNSAHEVAQRKVVPDLKYHPGRPGKREQREVDRGQSDSGPDEESSVRRAAVQESKCGRAQYAEEQQKLQRRGTRTGAAAVSVKRCKEQKATDGPEHRSPVRFSLKSNGHEP